jgi:hypothetical protein
MTVIRIFILLSTLYFVPPNYANALTSSADLQKHLGRADNDVTQGSSYALCKGRWKNDYKMLEHCLNQQNAAQNRVRGRACNRRSNNPSQKRLICSVAPD